MRGELRVRLDDGLEAWRGDDGEVMMAR